MSRAGFWVVGVGLRMRDDERMGCALAGGWQQLKKVRGSRDESQRFEDVLYGDMMISISMTLSFHF